MSVTAGRIAIWHGLCCFERSGMSIFPSNQTSFANFNKVAMTVNSRLIKTFLSWSPDAVDVPLTNGLRVQVLPRMEDLRRARKHQFAAFIASEALLIVWDDEAMNVVERARFIERELMELVWKT